MITEKTICIRCRRSLCGTCSTACASCSSGGASHAAGCTTKWALLLRAMLMSCPHSSSRGVAISARWRSGGLVAMPGPAQTQRVTEAAKGSQRVTPEQQGRMGDQESV
jgi:hypothetical protein